MTNADERIVAVKAKKKGLRVWAVREEPPLWVLEAPGGQQSHFLAWGSVDAWEKGVDGHGSRLGVIAPSCLIADNQRAEKAILDGRAEAL
jgi:hypothetical protein